MRLPRWLLAFLFAASAALLVVPAWIWVQLPRRYAATFIAAMDAKDTESANRVLSHGEIQFHHPQNGRDYLEVRFGQDRQGVFNFHSLVLMDRSIADVVHGRQAIALFAAHQDTHVRFQASWKEVRVERDGADQ